MLKSSQLTRKFALSRVVLLDFLAPRLACNQLTSPKNCFLRNASTNATQATRYSIFDGLDQVDVHALVNDLKTAIRDKDVLGAWKACSSIHKFSPGLIHGPQYYGAASSMIAGLYNNISKRKILSDDEGRAMEELAIICLAHGYPDGLRQMMVWHLVQGNVETVLKLHERFLSSIKNSETHGLEQATSLLVEESIALKNLHIEGVSISHHDIACITTLAIAAYAQTDSFHTALNLVLSNRHIQVNSKIVHDVSNNLYSCKHGSIAKQEQVEDKELANLVQKTDEYCTVARIARLVQRPEAFKAHLRNLLNERKTQAETHLISISSILLSGIEGEQPWASVSEKRKTFERPVVISEKSWAHLLNALVLVDREDIGQQLWGKMEDFGVNPGIAVWNAILEGFREVRQLNKLERTWRLMKEQGIAFDAAAYNAKINCLLEHGNRIEAFKLFDGFRLHGRKFTDSVLVFNTIINAYLKSAISSRSASNINLNKALALLESMVKESPQPDIVTYNSFISYYGKKGDLQGIVGIVERLAGAGLQPDVFTYTSILSALLKAKVPNTTARLLSIMEQTGVQKNTATYSAIIDYQVRQGTREGIQTAWEILQRMEVLPYAQPNIITYTSFLAGLHRSGELRKDEITKISRDVVQRMGNRKLHISRGAYHILLKSCLENLKPEGLEFFMEFFNDMEAKRIAFWPDTWFIIFRGLLERGEWGLASEMKDRMMRSGFSPTGGLLKLVGSIEGWEQVHKVMS